MDLCDVIVCDEEGKEDALFNGRLCAKHYDQLALDLQNGIVFRAAHFIGAPDIEEADGAAAQEGYSEWLARQR